jgi:hypothetical protein
LSSKNGWSTPRPRAIGAAGDWISGASAGGARRRFVARSSRVALSVAIDPDIGERADKPKGGCSRARTVARGTGCRDRRSP